MNSFKVRDVVQILLNGMVKCLSDSQISSGDFHVFVFIEMADVEITVNATRAV